MAYHFRPAAEFTEQHGLFVALVGGTNSGKSYSAMRLARGIAGPKGKIAAVDTEGGRILHLKKDFDFDVMVLGPPHRPERYLDVAQAAQEAGYAALLIDSFTMVWRGLGGVLDWMDAELDAAVERQRASAAAKGWQFDEYRARNANKMAASIRPKMAYKLMVSGFLGLRIPIIFAIRGEMTLDPDTKKEKFKPQCQPGFLFEVTVSFRLASEKRGIIDLSDPGSYKMEGAHRPIFRDGEQLSEQHGERLAAWARGGAAAPTAGAAAAPPAARCRWIAGNGAEIEFPSVDVMVADLRRRLANVAPGAAAAARERNAAILAELSAAGYGEQMLEISGALAQRIGEGAKAEATPV